MDIRALLTFVANHVEQIFGTTLVLFFLTCLLLLIRSIGSKKEGETGGAVTATIDAQSVEEAVRRALTAHGSIAATGGVTTGSISAIPDGATPESLNAAIRERDARIEQLSRELEQLRAQIATVVATPDGAAGGISDAEIAQLRAKLDEMQARLAEYEIIEDDIADLSMFKEENARLKIEIDELRAKLAGLGSGSTAAPTAPAIPVAEAVTTEPIAEPAAQSLPETVAETVAETSPAVVEAPAEDDVMREFAAAVQVQKAPPAVASTGIPIDAGTIAAMAASATPDSMQGTGAALDAFAQAQPREMVTEDPQAAVDAILAEAESQAAAAASALAEPASEPAPSPAQAFDDVLAGATDPEKMLSEVASLEASEAVAVEGAPSALEESLDTDKLLAEVGNLSAEAESSSSANQEDALNGDDLLSEFTSQSSKS